MQKLMCEKPLLPKTSAEVPIKLGPPSFDFRIKSLIAFLWISLGSLISLHGTFCFAQVPGICTLPNGSPWTIPPLPQSQGGVTWGGNSLPESSGAGAMRNNSNALPVATPVPIDFAAWKNYLDHSGSRPPVAAPSANATNPINRYAPHSVRHAKDPTPPPSIVPLPSIPPVESSSGRFTLSSRRQEVQDENDLLAPRAIPSPSPSDAKSNNDDLLAPMSSPPGDPLANMGPDAAKENERTQRRTPANNQAAIDPHLEVFANEKYPSAIACAKCHQKIYDEWRVSGHAYAAVSPMFMRFEQTVATLTRGTSGTFCVRCHAPVATQSDYPREAPIFSGPAVFREGITCIACHRVVERYGRVNGERRIETGSIYDPVAGTIGGDGIQKVIQDADNYKVKTDPNDKRPHQAIHQGAIKFEQLSDSSFCAGCHQVLVQPGIALEIVYQQYRSGPACKKGISCQDCHMGTVPGKPLGYEYGPAAEFSGKKLDAQRKHSNHIFHGPSYPLAHPGIFPHNEKSLRWTVPQWLTFEYRQGWGTEVFERSVAQGQIPVQFPPEWSSAQERRDARKVIEENEKVLAIKRGSAQQILENGSRIDGPFFATTPRVGSDLKVSYIVSNTSEGHNMPSGSLGAQPQLWLNSVLIGPDGSHLWESGHLDSNGDICDWHSLDVRAGKIPYDSQLANYQTKFLITNVKGTEREMYLPVNVDADPLPFFRPGTVPYTVLNHPPFVRMEAHSIPPQDSRTAHYKIPGHLITRPGVYRLSVRLRSRVEPPYFMIFCQGTPDMLQSLNEAIYDVHPYSVEFTVR